MAEPSHVLATRRNFTAKIAADGGLLLTGCDRLRNLQNKIMQHPAAQRSPDASQRAAAPADITLRIGHVVADIAKDHAISTTGYNGSAPGPLLRLSEGATVTVDLINETSTPEFVHWHGFIVPPDVDGAEEENTLFGDSRPAEEPDETFPLVFGKVNGGIGGFNFWTVNGKSFENKRCPPSASSRSPLPLRLRPSRSPAPR